jgi:tetratricopeptide (TPR) repeat protein
MVVGSIFKSGEEIRIDVQVEDVGTGRILSAESVRGTDVFPMVDDLTTRIRTGLRLTDAPATPPIADVSTASLEAYRLYTEALDARRNVRYADARVLLEEAIALDPSFAMARFELARIARVFGQPELEEDHMARVLENLNRLPEREKALIQARQVRLSGGDTTRAVELLESLIDKYPDEEDAYFEIATNTRGRDNPWTSWLEPRFVLATARLLREHGETEAARTEYRRFLELWKNADPGLPELREANEFLGE